MNNTPTYWDADGTSLHTFAHSIETLGGLLKAAPLRGEDVTIPYVPGQTWVEKIPDSRVLNLAMWVRGVDEDSPGATPTRAMFDKNWNRILRTLWTPGRQVALRKRFYDDAGLIQSATAMAEWASGLEPRMTGKALGKALVDMKLADPFFYDDSVQSIPLSNGDQTVTIKGNAPTRHIIATINGSRINPLIKVKSPGSAHQVEYHASLSSGDNVVINMRTYSSTTDPAATAPYDSELDIRTSGSPYWMVLQPGANVINLSSTSGAGTVVLQVRGAWL